MQFFCVAIMYIKNSYKLVNVASFLVMFYNFPKRYGSELMSFLFPPSVYEDRLINTICENSEKYKSRSKVIRAKKNRKWCRQQFEWIIEWLSKKKKKKLREKCLKPWYSDYFFFFFIKYFDFVRLAQLYLINRILANYINVEQTNTNPTAKWLSSNINSRSAVTKTVDKL